MTSGQIFTEEHFVANILGHATTHEGLRAILEDDKVVSGRRRKIPDGRIHNHVVDLTDYIYSGDLNQFPYHDFKPNLPCLILFLYGPDDGDQEFERSTGKVLITTDDIPLNKMLVYIKGDQPENETLQIHYKQEWKINLTEFIVYCKHIHEISSRVTNLLEIYAKYYQRAQADRKRGEMKPDKPRKAWLREAPSSSKDPAPQQQEEEEEPRQEPQNKGGNWSSWSSWGNWRWNWRTDHKGWRQEEDTEDDLRKKNQREDDQGSHTSHSLFAKKITLRCSQDYELDIEKELEPSETRLT